MQQAVDQQPRGLLRVTAGIGQSLNPRSLEAIPQASERRDRRPFRPRQQERRDFFIDDPARGFDFALASGAPLFNPASARG